MWKRRNLQARGIQGCRSIPAADTIAEVATLYFINGRSQPFGRVGIGCMIEPAGKAAGPSYSEW